MLPSISKITPFLQISIWFNALSNVTTVEDVAENMLICVKHWPGGFETTKKERTRPKHAPKLFFVSRSYIPQTFITLTDMKGRSRLTFRGTSELCKTLL